MLDFLLSALTLTNLLYALLGVAAGTIIGSIPGLTATMAVAVLVPITFAMPPESALILLGAIYTGAIYGGAYAAILLKTPGTPSAIATTFDGYPMAKRGDGDLAISIACLASVIGGLVGAFSLLLLAPPLASAALAFGPVEYFWLAVFGLSLIAALSTGDFLKGAIGGALGLLISTIGVSETSAEVRFTFGFNTLIGGVEVVSALIGLYCIPVLMDLVATPERHLDAPQTKGFRFGEALRALSLNKFNVIRSSVIGTLVGALPGAGGSIAGLVAYSEARRTKSGDETPYGEGNAGGVIACESANNATVGGGFIPTLVLGIPGTPPDAVILGALLIQGVRTGPSLFADGAGVVYTFIFGLILATLLMLPVGLLIGRFAYRAILRAPKSALVPIVAFMTVIGAFAIRNSLSDVAIMILLGVFGWIVSKRGFDVSPIVLGLILGSIAEQGFVQSWTIGDAIGDLWGQFFGRPLSIAIIVMILVTTVIPLAPRIRAAMAGRRVAVARPRAPAGAIGLEVASFVFFGLVALVAVWKSGALNPEAAVFPRTVAIGMAALAAIGLVRALVSGQVTGEAAEGSVWRRAATPLIMLAGVAAIPTFGFMAGGAVMALLLIVPAQHDRLSPLGHGGLALSVLAVALAFTLAFGELLDVPLPVGEIWR